MSITDSSWFDSVATGAATLIAAAAGLAGYNKVKPSEKAELLTQLTAIKVQLETFAGLLDDVEALQKDVAFIKGRFVERDRRTP